MHILYDGHIYAIQNQGGINRYFTNIINHLPENYVPTLTAIHKRETQYPLHPKLHIYKYKRFRLSSLSMKIEKQYFDFFIGHKKFNLAHPTNYLLLAQKEIKEYSYPVVLTVHDMIHEIFTDQMDPNGEIAEVKRKAILAADAILCVSENTKKDLIENYHIPEKKITVTYLASELNSSLSYGLESVPNQPYFIYVGGRKKYKNFEILLTALKKIITIYPEVKLCVVGSPFDSIEQRRITELSLVDNIEYFNSVSDSHLAKLYRCSIALVYPSLYEGFGIPPLEAMACNTAVVASNTSSIPEVVGDAGILFNPKASNELSDILLFLLNHPSEREKLIVKGQERVKAFSWDKTAAQTFNLYNSLV